ncbi:MAG: SUMF1/EgtB/PvdO family nonheme iron enzyme, partial [Candidatus Micrarchaeota archaeon]
MRTWKGLPWNWKSFVVAGIIAAFLIAFVSAAAGVKSTKNIYWTAMWIYLSVEAWKYLRWRALLAYPLFLFVYIMVGSIMEGIGVNVWFFIIVLGGVNIGGLILFYIFISKEYTKVSSRFEAQREGTLKVIKESSPIANVTPATPKILASDKAELGNSVDRKVSEPQGQGIMDVQDISHSGSIPKADPKSLDKSLPSDEAFYEQAFNELESEGRKLGLWAKVFAEAQGNESLAKANYLKFRAEQLVNEQQQAILEEERQRQEEEKAAEIERLRQENEYQRALLEEERKRQEEKIREDERRRQEEEKIKEMERARTFTSPTLKAIFVLIPAGTFIMGSPSSESGRDDDETQHQVTISQPFYMQTTPVTQGQWQKVMIGSSPAHFTSWRTETDNYPVEMVCWNDIQAFIRNLNSREGTDKYRLPTEAEWEYAARAGCATVYCCGNDNKLLSE